jgi:uncharacterized phiE125 gp8 family phage protein
MRRLELISGPECYPVTLDEVKAQRNRSDTLDDSYLTACIKAMTDHAENVTRRQLCTAVYELTVEAWNPSAVIELPKPPLQSVTSITSVDYEGEETELDASTYEVITDTIVGFVRPAYGETWPDARFLVIRYSCGYPTTGSPATATTPEAIKQWMLARIGTMDVFRESILAGQTVGELPRDFVDCLLDAYIIPEVV